MKASASVKIMTFVRENQIIPWQGVYFFTNTVLQNHRNIYTVVMKNMMNTIGKKIHTLVKENTQRWLFNMSYKNTHFDMFLKN